MSTFSPFARLLMANTRANRVQRGAPGAQDGSAGPAGQRTPPQSMGAHRRRAGQSKVARPGTTPIPDFSHLMPPPPDLEPDVPDPAPEQDGARAAAILALPAARTYSAVAARLAADPHVTAQVARDVLATCAPAAARQANSKAHPLVADMLHVRGLVDGGTHAAAPRDPALARHDRHNAAAAAREARDGELSPAQRATFARAYAALRTEGTAA